MDKTSKKSGTLAVIIGGVIIIIDSIGRIQTVADIFHKVKELMPLILQFTLPNYLITWIGFLIVAFGCALHFWPTNQNAPISDTKQNPVEPDDAARRAAILANAPHIDLIYNLPKVLSAQEGLGVRETPITVVNTTEYVAYDVQIGDMNSSWYSANFEKIPRIEKGVSIPAKVKIRNRRGYGEHSQFEALLKFEVEDQRNGRSDAIRPNQSISVPLVVQFADKNGNVFVIRHEVVYKPYFGEAEIILVQGATLEHQTGQ